MKAKKLYLRDYWNILKKTYTEWNETDPFRESAIIAYYAIFSLPALLVIIITVAGAIFGADAARGEVSTQISGAMGKDTALQIEEMIENASRMKNSVFATIIGIATLLFGATGVFAQLQKSLNIIWEIKPKEKQKWTKMLKDRLFSFGLILSIGFLLLISLGLTSILSLVSSWLQARLPEFIVYLFFIIEFLLSLGMISILFALMFKILPDAKIKWRHVWTGSIITGVLFVIGKFLLGLYFGKAEPGSTYGAAGSVILILLWVSYSCMILFFGAEFTRQYTLAKDGEPETEDFAERAPERRTL